MKSLNFLQRCLSPVMSVSLFSGELFFLIFLRHDNLLSPKVIRSGYRTAATSKVELFVIIVTSFQPLTIITKSSTLDVAAVLDPHLLACFSILEF